MGGEELALEPAGGMDEPCALGTDAERVRAAIERAMSDDGVLVLMDLGSALMSTEFAIEMLGDASGRVLMSEAPLVEGAVAAAVAARGGATLEEVAEEARGALAMKASQLGAQASPDADVDAAAPAPPGAPAPPPDAEAALPVRNAIGLHARPAARFVEVARSFEAEVRVAKAGGGEPVRATSLTNVVALGARLGDTLVGVPASPGIAVGPARRLRGPAGPPADRPAGSPDQERARLEEAIAAAREAIARDRDAVAGRAGEAEAAIFDAHAVLLDDEALRDPAHEAIAAGATAERAWHDAADQVAARYRALDEPLLRERAADVLDVGRRVVGAIVGGSGAPGGSGAGGAPTIITAIELTPADTAGLDP